MSVNRRFVTRAACMAFACACATTAHAQLIDPGFELAGSGTPFANWIDFNNSIGNISRASEAVRTGTFSAKIYGTFAGDLNVSGIYQDLPTTRDKVWDASAYFQHLMNDRLMGANVLAMNVEFRASNGDLLEYWGIDGITAATTVDTWHQRQVVATAPDDAVIARLAFVYVQPDIDGGAGHIDDASLSSSTTSALLINPGFEDFGGFGAAQNARGWGQFPRFASNIFRNSDIPRTGGFAGFMYGQFNSQPNYNGFYQTFNVAPGQRVDAEVFARQKGNDRLAGGNFGFINIEFYNAANQLIGPIISNPGINNASAVDTWLQLPVSAFAPAGSTTVRLVIGMYQENNAVGAVHFDDASVAITNAPPPFCTGDANGSGSVNFADITTVLNNFNNVYTPGSAGLGDANNSGVVNFADITTVLNNFNNAC